MYIMLFSSNLTLLPFHPLPLVINFLPGSAFRWPFPLFNRFLPESRATSKRRQSRRRRIHRRRHSSRVSMVAVCSSAVGTTPLDAPFGSYRLDSASGGGSGCLVLLTFLFVSFGFVLVGLFVKLGDETVVPDYARGALSAEGDVGSLKTRHGWR